VAAARGDVIFVFGGQTLDVTLDDLWSFHTVSREWTLIKQRGTNPGPRSGAVGCVQGRFLYLLGGFDGALRCDGVAEAS
jgi:hypothetical protein